MTTLGQPSWSDVSTKNDDWARSSGISDRSPRNEITWSTFNSFAKLRNSSVSGPDRPTSRRICALQSEGLRPPGSAGPSVSDWYDCRHQTCAPPPATPRRRQIDQGQAHFERLRPEPAGTDPDGPGQHRAPQDYSLYEPAAERALTLPKTFPASRSSLVKSLRSDPTLVILRFRAANHAAKFV